jgi:proline iminopeptidase
MYILNQQNKKNIFILILILHFVFSAKSQETQIMTSDSVLLHVTVKGQGIPCLYLHGGPGSGSYWAQKFTGDIFENKFQMVYLDQRGCCRSSDPIDNNYSMDRMIQDIEEIRLALGIDQWIIMGHSFGGLLQIGYALRHPDVLKGMIMINCT